MARDSHTVPLPPARLSAPLPPLVEQVLVESWRIHREVHPLRPQHHARGRFRFDAPGGEFPVTYVNLDRHGCYAEVFGDAREIPPWAATRRLSRIRADRPLRVVALDRAAVQKAFGLDLNVCSSLDYERTQAWSRAWHEGYPHADGIRYLGRHGVENRNLCLFLDRCGGHLEAVFEGYLEDLRRDGLIVAYKYNLVPRLFFPQGT
jgi:hypothetical protein